MTVIVCLDNRNGMLFAGRRQSMDRALRDRVLRITDGSLLWMNSYSAGQFPEAAHIRVDERFLEKAGEEDFCFVENADLLPFRERIKRMIIYRWNRDYPSDKKLSAEILEVCGMSQSRWDFPGTSHDNITEEVYDL